jgi:hypothetical protein
VVRFRVDTRPSGNVQQHWNEDVQAGAEATYVVPPEPDYPAMANRIAERSIMDLVDGYLDRQRVWRAEGPALRKTLTTGAVDLRIEAIRAVATRRLTGEVPALLQLLSNEEETVRDAALGALVELHDRRAVSEIARQRSMRDRREMRKIIDAIGTLGGQEAIDYLSFVAEGHDEEEIRQMAKQALERIKRKN